MRFLQPPKNFRAPSLGLFWSALVLAVAGCTAGSGADPLAVPLLLTNQPSANVAVEVQNHQNPNNPFRVYQSEDLVQDLRRANLGPSLVVGTDIVYPQAAAFRVLGGLVEGVVGNAVLLAYDLPVVVFPRTPANALPPVEGRTEFASRSMEVEQLRSAAEALNRRTAGRLDRVGFDPLWDPVFVEAIFRLYGADFRAAPDLERRLTWDGAGLAAALAALRAWHSGPSREELVAFEAAYTYDPWFQLLLDRRVGFRVRRFSEYLSLPETYRSQLEFRWLVHEDQTAAAENPIFAAIPEDAKQSAAAAALLNWVQSPAGIRSVTEGGLARGLPAPLYFGGIPADPTDSGVFRDFLVEAGLPSRHRILFPSAMPAQWQRIRAEVIFPWAAERLTAGDTVLRSESRGSALSATEAASRREALLQEDEASLTRRLLAWQALYRAE